MPSGSTPEQIKQGRDALNELTVRSRRGSQVHSSTRLYWAGDREALKAFEDVEADAAVVRVATASEKEALAELEKVASRVLA